MVGGISATACLILRIWVSKGESAMDLCPRESADATVSVAAEQLYLAEIALHAARQSGYDPWIRAASDKLHEAATTYDRLVRRPVPHFISAA
jgi:hypothetical protein